MAEREAADRADAAAAEEAWRAAEEALAIQTVRGCVHYC